MFGNWETFNQHIDRLLQSGRVECQKDLYYFVRPTRFGTIEIRCCDLPLNIDSVIALATLIQVLVVYLQEHPNERSAADLLHCDLVDAIANGPHATLQTPYGKACSATDFLESLVDRLRPTARKLGSQAELERIPSALSINGAELQIAQRNKVQQTAIG